MPDAGSSQSIILPTWDLIITMMLIVGVGYGIVLQREKIIATLVGLYAGIVVAQNWGPSVYEFFSGNNVLFNSLWIKSNISPFAVKAILFGLVVVVLTTKSDFSRNIQETNSPIGGIMVIAYSFFTTTLAISAVLSFLPKAQLAVIVARSYLADFMISNYMLWVILPIVAMIIGGIFSSRAPAPPPPDDYYRYR